MSSPPDSITDIDESALNKKRGRAQSVEPAAPQDINDEVNSSQETSLPTVSAPKKTKRDDEDKSTTVSAIRRNMKDMSTTDDVRLAESQSTASDSQDDEPMGPIAEEEDTSGNNNSLLATFGGAKKEDDDDEWAEFAENEEETTNNKSSTVKADEKPKYTFGASSGFGTKGWAATHQTIPTPSKQPTFGGFGSSSGFGGFKSASQPSLKDSAAEKASSLSSGSVNTSNSTVSSTPTFGSFAKATSSPFAAAAAAGNALGSQETTSPISSTTTSVVEKETHSEENDNDSPTTFGEGAKVKVPGVKQTEVKTGEEDEDTVYQTKGKLLVLDTRTGNWKERGVGTFRINMKEDAKKVLQTRLVMRTDSVYRVILNLLLFEGMKVFIMQDKFVRFAGFETETKEDGTVETKLISFALKLSNPNVAQEVCDRINEHIPLPASSSQ